MKKIILVTSLIAITCLVQAAEPFKAARSVHLGYPAPEGSYFYNEMVVEESVDGSYFMVCGWNTGYFGIQQLKETNKVAIFSVWDPTKGDDPKAVKTEDRVELLHEGPGVRIKRFGGEGTGGQSMMPFDWKVGETNRFLMGATTESNKTAYTAWIFDPKKQDWFKMATFRVRTGGKPLSGYYSFVEDFKRNTKSVDQKRKARFGNGWVKPVTSDWVPLEKARFTASNATWESKENIDGGVTGNWFYLATGGDIKASRELRSTITVKNEGKLPANLPK